MVGVVGTLGERVQWSRNQQGLTLEVLSERAGVAIGYISQIEHGSKTNPTREVLESLARSLNVTVAFLLGEVEMPGPLTLAGTGRVGVAFAEAVKGEAGFRLMTCEERFRHAARFLFARYPRRWTRPVLAFELGLSVRELNDILDRDWELRLFTLIGFCRVTGISLDLMLTGEAAEALPDVSAERFYRRYARWVQRKRA